MPPAIRGVVAAVALSAFVAGLSAAEPDETPGLVPGAVRPAGDGPAIQVPGGWMVPYDEAIPGTGVAFRMIPVPGGTFRMGTPRDEGDLEADEEPQVEVRVDPFWMARCEVSWGEYKQYMAAFEIFTAMRGANIRPITAANEIDAVTAPSSLYEPTTTFANGEDDALPAVTMTQFAARQYTKWLSGLTGRFYRLPAESEWEYACRAGTTTPWNTGDDADELAAAAWFADNSAETTHSVGQKAANAWGLHDMHGNVAEWCVDELVAGGYGRQAALPQPVGVAEAITWPQKLYPRVLRGGAYYDEAAECRSAARRGSRDAGGTRENPDWKDVDPNLPKSPWWYTEEPALGVGMRVVRPLAEPDVATRRRWWDADVDSIRDDTAARLREGRGALGIVDPKLPADLKAEGIVE